MAADQWRFIVGVAVAKTNSNQGHVYAEIEAARTPQQPLIASRTLLAAIEAFSTLDNIFMLPPNGSAKQQPATGFGVLDTFGAFFAGHPRPRDLFLIDRIPQ